MSRDELKCMIDSLMEDIEFDFWGVHGSICPFSRSDIVVGYGVEEVRCKSVEEAMSVKIFDGKSLNEISLAIQIY